MGDWDLPRDPLVALREGNPAPFEDFVRTHVRLLVAWFRRQGAGLHRAEDLTQEVMIKLHDHAPRYRAQERFPAFCFRVARNVWIDDRRRMGARPRGVSLDGGDDEGSGARGRRLGPENVLRGPTAAPSPPEQAHLHDADERLRNALLELSESHRAVFELGAIEGLSYAEIGEILEVPVGTVKSRMFYAVRHLRGALEELEEDVS